MSVSQETETAVRQVLNDIADAYTERNMEKLMSTIAADPDVIMYGTGADEKRRGISEIRTQAERDWSQSDEASLTYGWMSISGSDSVAWVAADVEFNVKAGDMELSVPGRFTGVLQRQGDRWLLVQSHYSVPAPQEEGQSFPS